MDNNEQTTQEQAADTQPAILDGAAQDGTQAAPQTQEQTPSEPDKKAEGSEPAKPERPEGLADEFWDDASGVKMTELLAKLNELSTFKAEADVKSTGVPETADAYELAVPDDLEVPDGMEITIAEDDPMLLSAKGWAKEAGLTQEQFNGLTGLYMKSKAAEAASLKDAVKAEMTKLGENGRARVDAVVTALNGRIGHEATNKLLPMMYTADQVQAFEKLVRTGQATAPAAAAGASGQPGKAWSDMTPDEKFMSGHENAKRNGQVGPIVHSNQRG